MKFIKYLFFLILIVIISGTVYFSAQDGSYNIAATKAMNVPTNLAFQAANDYNKWMEWGPWMDLDPAIDITMGDTTAGISAGYSWVSEHPDVGSGTLLTTKVVNNESLEQQILFNNDFTNSESTMYWRFEPQEDSNGVNVIWGIKGEMTLIDKIVAAFSGSSNKTPTLELYERGLTNMENSIKESMTQYTVSFDGISEYGGGYYMYVTASANQAGIAAKMAPMLSKVSSYMQTNKIAQNGMPFTIYNVSNKNTGNFIFSTCIPVKERIITTNYSDVLCGYMPPLVAIKVTLKGEYGNLQEAYSRAYEYITLKGLTQDPANPSFEVYTNDPEDYPNPADWLTEVYIPIVAPQETIN